VLAGHGEDPSEPVPLVGGALAQGVDEHEGALALPDVPEDLLAVPSLVADQVQDVVLDLERRAEEEPEQGEAVGVDRPRRSDQRSDPARVDGPRATADRRWGRTGSAAARGSAVAREVLGR
jgi:hypothetical protein